MKYAELFQKGKEELEKAAIEEAELDARLLLEYVCDTGRNDLLVHGDREVASGQAETYLAYIERRAGHEPLQRITGEQEFMGLNFKVTGDVLIPRQDTETLVEEVMLHLHDGMRILDIGCGSGCILLSLLHYSNDCTGIGCDISKPALKVAEENAKNLHLTAKFVQSDLFERIEGKYDFIVSNPPYIASAVIPSLMEEVRDHEPLGALDGGKDGLSFYRRIVQDAPAYLYPEGMLFLEIGCDQGNTVKELMETAGFREVEIRKDLAGLDRVVCGICTGNCQAAR